MKTMKQILASTLVVLMVIAGLVITPLDAKAAETEIQGENGVIFVLDAEKYNFTTLWATKTAPEREGYVFGGWYTSDDATEFTAVTQTAAEEGQVDAAKTYAKFVPAEVLSIRAQLQKETEDGSDNREEGDKTYLRLLSGVNGLDYQKVGFDILYNKKTPDSETNKEIATNITKVFSKITNQETNNSAMVASELFGKAATHFSVLRLDGIGFNNYTKVIYVTPQWTTLDGTLVEGQAKYVRVMDGYTENRYISVPVNFTEGSKVAAGQIEIKYDAAQVQLVTTEGKGFDTGLIMPEMNYYDDGNGTIKIVGNVDNKTNVAPDSNIFANLWFTAKDAVADGTALNFDIVVGEKTFCTWEEEWVENVIAQDIKYLK